MLTVTPRVAPSVRDVGTVVQHVKNIAKLGELR